MTNLLVLISGGSNDGQSGHAPNPAMPPIQLLNNCLNIKTQQHNQKKMHTQWSIDSQEH